MAATHEHIKMTKKTNELNQKTSPVWLRWDYRTVAVWSFNLRDFMFFKIEPSSKYYFLVSHQIKRNKDQENGSILLKGNPEAPDSGSGFSLFTFFSFPLPSVYEQENNKRKYFLQICSSVHSFLSFPWGVHSFSQNNYTLLFGIFLLENELLQ